MKIDKIYFCIGEEISNAIIEEGWKEARLHFEIVGNGVVGYTGEYIDYHNKKKDIDVFAINSDIVDWVRELHEITTAENSNQWNRATFTLFHDGNFNMDFQWDQELDDEINSLS